MQLRPLGTQKQTPKLGAERRATGRLVAVTGVLALLIGLGGCGGGALLLGLVGKPLVGLLVGAAVKSDDIEVTPANPTVPVGARVPFRVEAFSLLGNKIPVDRYRWELNNPVPAVPGTTVGTIDSDSGLFHATAEGTVTVESTVIGLSGVSKGTTVVTVSNRFALPITTLAIYPSRLTLPAGQSLRLLAVATDVNGLPMAVGFAWSLPAAQAAVGTLSVGGGLFTAAAPGTATVQVQAGGSTATAEVTVVAAPAQVGALAAIVVNPPSALLGPGGTQQFVAYGLDKDGNFLSLTAPSWSVESSVGSVSAAGLLTAGTTAATGAVVAAQGEYQGKAQVQVQ
ncbi:MAG: hypothetical protein CO096_00675 [Armatimonadetes bacterium CG_4_9_14_3_um_filter_66_14]|nr:MAG: hypothetical protein CO096_00675 [Armatimonadetes bacterium CG_4_9_14_3_um_filter_66_14]